MLETLLEQYNPHWDNTKPYQDLFPRNSYSQKIAQLLDRREIIVLKGIRRSGKSSMLKLLIKDLLKKKVSPQNILFMNLEDYRFGPEKSVNTLDEIYQAYKSHTRPRGKIYILLDEIQEISGFEKWLRTYYEQQTAIKFIITGSSSSLFSTELATLLTGRQISIEIFPFSFNEYLEYRAEKVYKKTAKKNIDSLYLSTSFKEIDPCLRRFLDQGGFPEIVKHEQPEQNILLLQQYIEDIILKDIARRYNIRKIEVLQKLALFLIFNMGGAINISRIAQLVGSNRTTILELIAYLKEVYMVFTSTSFSFSVNEQLSTTKPKRVYCIDNGFFAAIKTESEHDFSKKFRNSVYQTLRFTWEEDIFYWKDKVEIDFILKNGFPIGAAAGEKDIDREVYRLFHYMHQHNIPQGLLVSWSKLQILEENERRLVIMPLWLLLLKSKEEILNYTD